MRIPSSHARQIDFAPAAKLFTTGSIVGTLVDSLHNQCLLEYHFCPLIIDNHFSESTGRDHLLASSWVVPPLLGVAYVVLGSVLPRFVEFGLERIEMTRQMNHIVAATMSDSKKQMKKTLLPVSSESSSKSVGIRAAYAVVTTAMLIKLSSYLEVSSTPHGQEILILLALLQWAVLDGSLSSLLVATLASIGGPLAELPFVGHEIWTYLPTAADYFPLQNLTVENTGVNTVIQTILGTNNYQSLALASITGPCYFAVTMDAIACGRAFSIDTENDAAAI
ncbi:hypothetical protein MPSEU_000664000 [Mayamaea pseudoterrestris]|nr:hypothetical protein MPSEU_000664000 [Mayamaea pseudoterrestris]